MINRKIIPLFIAFLFPLVVFAEIYYWVDEKGVKHYSSSPPESKKGIRDYQVVETMSEISTPEESRPGMDSNQKAAHKIVMYTTSGNQFCDSARTWLQKKKIPFQERNVKKDVGAMREYKNLQGTDFPLFIIDNNWLQGWNEEAMQNYLGMKKKEPTSGSKGTK